MRPNREWRPAPGHPDYIVSSWGDVFSLRRAVLLKPQDVQRYAHVSLNQKIYYVHRLVMAAFVGPCPEGHEVNHKSGDRTNNRLTNLEYVTPSANHVHSRTVLKRTIGETHGMARLTESKIKGIRRLSTAGVSRNDLALAYECSPSNIKRIVKRETWKHVGG